MKTKLAIASTALLAGCTSTPLYQSSSPSYTPPTSHTSNGTATGYRPTPNMSVDSYKRMLAKQITAANPDKVYPGNPQAMLRSVVVLKYVVDSNGRLVRSDTLRSNGDSATVSTAMSALRKAAPFPPPPANLLDRGGRMEILETALFNDDGRFQLRSIALPQSD
jgi:protein TonB